MNQFLESYKILKVKVGAPLDEITSAYRHLCNQYILEVTGSTEAAEQMRDINAAYCYLRDKLNRAEKLKKKLSPDSDMLKRVRRYRVNVPYGRGGSAKQASFYVLRAYLKALMSGEIESAYSYVCDYDKQFITKEGFRRWREAVGRECPIREFSIEETPAGATVTLKNGKGFPARKYRVVITERNAETKDSIRKREEKLVINESGRWGVFLGDSDLKTVSRISDGLRESLKKSKVPPELGIMNLNGLQREIKKEQYRQRRYGGAFTIGIFTVENDLGDVSEDMLGVASAEIKKLLRETDIPAFIGQTSFAVLFVGLKKKNAEQIMKRIADRLIDVIEKKTGASVRVGFEARVALKSDGGGEPREDS